MKTVPRSKYKLFRALGGLFWASFGLWAAGGCSIPKLPESSRTMSLIVRLEGLHVSQTFTTNGRLCLVTHFHFACKRLDSFKREPGKDLYLYDSGAYEDRSYLPGNEPGRGQFGVTLSYRTVEGVKMSGQLDFGEFRISREGEGILFLTNRTPPGYRTVEAGRGSMDDYQRWPFLQQYFMELGGLQDQRRVTLYTPDRKKPATIFVWLLEKGELKPEMVYKDLVMTGG